MRHLLPGPVPVFAALIGGLLVSCGGGGGAAAPVAAGGGSTGGSAVERAVPGYTIAARRLTAVQAGQPCAIRFTVAADAGQAATQRLEVWLGSGDYAPPAVTSAATPVAGSADAWEVSVPLPSPLSADATVWLRLTTADGAVLEVGRSAFEIADLSPAGG